MPGRNERLRQAAVAEGQRRRIVRLLEEIAGVDEKDQCPNCGDWFAQLSSHEPHCNGPE